MSTDRPDDLDAPSLRPLPPGDRDIDLREDYGEEPPPYPPRRPPWYPELKPGFGFWMAVVWCILFFVATQIIIGFACGIPLILGAVLMDGANQNAPPDPNQLMKSDAVVVASLLGVVCAHLGGMLFGWLILRWQVGRDWKRRIALTRGPTLTHVALVLIGLPAMLALASAWERPVMEYVPSLQELLDRAGIKFQFGGLELMMELFKQAPWPLLVFAVAVLPAVNEELWCRGFIAHGLAGRYAGWAVVLITSFLFGCLHVDPRHAIGVIPLGAVIHAAYLATRSLWVAIGIHFANNGLAVTHVNEGINLPVLQPLEDVLARSPVLFVAGAAALFAAVAYALYQTRGRLAPEMEGMPVWEPRGVSDGAELPPPGSGTVVAHDPLSPLSAALVVAGAVAFGLVLAFA